MGSILYMKELPPDNGGDTLFANMYRGLRDALGRRSSSCARG